MTLRIAPGTGNLVAAAASAASATLWSVWRDLRRVRTVMPLEPPTAAIDVEVRPQDVAASARPLQLLALGDSSVAGIGADRLEGCLAVQVAQRVADTTGQPVRVRGYGMSGARTADVAASQVTALDTRDGADAVVVVVGMNDIVHATPPWAYRSAVLDLYEQLRERLDDVPVVACSLPEVRSITIVGHPLRDIAATYGRLLSRIQRQAVRRVPNVAFVDARRSVGPAFLRRPEAMSVDGFHPSTLGYGLLADALAPTISTALGSERDALAMSP